VSLSGPRSVAAELPVIIPGNDASRTLRWGMNTSEGLTLQDIALDSGTAELPWTYANISWADGPAFERNGTQESNLTFTSDGVELAANLSNHITNGHFATDANWSFANGKGEVVTGWDDAARNAEYRSVSASTESLWNGMNSTVGWRFDASPNITAGFHVNTTNPPEGIGTIEIDVSSVFDADSHYVGIQRMAPVDWSGSDRLVLWVDLNNSDAVTFQITAINSSNAFVHTSPQALATGPQRVAADLLELGSRSDRSSLSALTLRFDGVFTPPMYVLVDDARVGLTKAFQDSAAISQSFVTTTSTTPTLGSAVLAWNWTATNVTNVSDLKFEVNVSGPLGTFVQTLPISATVPWQRASADVSSILWLPDSYEVRFEVHVAANTTGPINATVRIDDVSLLIPNRHDAAYVSAVLPLGLQSEFLSLAWGATRPASTSIVFGVRSGNTSNPDDGNWTDWQLWTVAGSYRPAAGGASRVQFRADLNTTNASASPTLRSLLFETRHRASQGSIVSDPYTAATDFLRWRTIKIISSAAPQTSIRFYVGGLADWTEVSSGANLSAYVGRTIQWRAELNTSNGLVTPSLIRVDLIYEYLGQAVRVAISPGGPLTVTSDDTIQFHAFALDAGSHADPSAEFTWSTTDRDGQVVDGEYRAGQLGTWNVTATLVGRGLTARVQVHVVAAPSLLLAQLGPLALVLALAGGGVYVGYTVVVRRMFAIDDVFLISRDGRLMLHNTRRMRADRDEDILSAMLTAILTFLRDFDPEEDGQLRRFDIGGKTALLERGAHAYLAAVYSGRVPRWAGKDLRRFMSHLEARFGETFAHWTGSPQDLQGLKKFSERFVSRVRYRPGRGARKPAS